MHRSPPTLSLDESTEALKSSSPVRSALSPSSLPATQALDDLINFSSNPNKRLKVTSNENTHRSSLMSLVKTSVKYDMTDLFNATAQSDNSLEFPNIGWALDVDDDCEEKQSNKVPSSPEDGDPVEIGSAFGGAGSDSTTGSRRVKSMPCFMGKRKLSGLVRSKTLRSEVDRLVSLKCTN